METPTHARLKALAFEFLLAQGCSAVAAEVGCPISRYRIDVAGYLDKLPDRLKREPQASAIPRGAKPLTAFIECKASRPDFLRDHRQTPDLLAQRDRFQKALDRLRNEVVKPMEPHLRRSTGFLFAEMESWDFNQSQLHAHRALLRTLRKLDEKIYAQTKFFMLAQYRLADRLYILAPRSMIAPKELPRGWGLLEARDDEIRVIVEPSANTTKDQYVHRTLRNIAVAGTRDAKRNRTRRPQHVPGRDARLDASTLDALIPHPSMHS